MSRHIALCIKSVTGYLVCGRAFDPPLEISMHLHRTSFFFSPSRVSQTGLRELLGWVWCLSRLQPASSEACAGRDLHWSERVGKSVSRPPCCPSFLCCSQTTLLQSSPVQSSTPLYPQAQDESKKLIWPLFQPARVVVKKKDVASAGVKVHDRPAFVSVSGSGSGSGSVSFLPNLAAWPAYHTVPSTVPSLH